MCIDDLECKMGLQLLTEAPGWKAMSPKYGMHEGGSSEKNRFGKAG